MAFLGGQFKSATHGQFKSAQGGQFDRILQSHSFNRSIHTSFHYFIRLPQQLQHRTSECFVPQHLHLSPPTTTAFPLIFTCEMFAP